MTKIAILPTLLTLGNAVCGFAAIALCSKATPETANYYFGLSGWLIIAAMLFDSLDGYVARLSRSASSFGAQLDSLCDAISFGAAPAFLLLRMGPGWEQPRAHQAVAVCATLYMLCTILRLARFNVESASESANSKRFRGLPSPAAAGCLASLAILRGGFLQKGTVWDDDLFLCLIAIGAPIGALLVALLMVSRLPYPHLTKQLLRGRRQLSHLIQIIVGALVLWLLSDLALVLVFWGYALGVPVYVWGCGLKNNTASLQMSGLEDHPSGQW